MTTVSGFPPPLVPGPPAEAEPAGGDVHLQLQEEEVPGGLSAARAPRAAGLRQLSPQGGQTQPGHTARSDQPRYCFSLEMWRTNGVHCFFLTGRGAGDWVD